MNTLGIVDYGAGNLSSVCNSFKAAGFQSHLVKEERDLEGITHLVLPGVGAFGDCATALARQGLTRAIKNWIAEDKPFLGICIGYQILFECSEETPNVPGLGIFQGQVHRFTSDDVKVPHMGWNFVSLTDPHDCIWSEIGTNPYFYFVHSYFPIPVDRDIVAATCEYGENFSAAIRRGNLIATQFHPEKSQVLGIRLLQNFMKLGKPLINKHENA